MNDRPQASDVEFIRALAELLRENDLSEIEVRRRFGAEDTINVRVVRKAEAPAAAPAPPAQLPAPVAGSEPYSPGTTQPPTPSNDPADDPGAVPSPMVGTAYLQPEPDSPAFIKVGDTVNEEDVVGTMMTDKAAIELSSPVTGQVLDLAGEPGAAAVPAAATPPRRRA